MPCLSTATYIWTQPIALLANLLFSTRAPSAAFLLFTASTLPVIDSTALPLISRRETAAIFQPALSAFPCTPPPTLSFEPWTDSITLPWSIIFSLSLISISSPSPPCACRNISSPISPLLTARIFKAIFSISLTELFPTMTFFSLFSIFRFLMFNHISLSASSLSPLIRTLELTFFLRIYHWYFFFYLQTTFFSVLLVSFSFFAFTF